MCAAGHHLRRDRLHVDYELVCFSAEIEDCWADEVAGILDQHEPFLTRPSNSHKRYRALDIVGLRFNPLDLCFVVGIEAACSRATIT